MLILFLSGMYVFIFGESGLLERQSLSLQKQTLMGQIKTLKEENLLLKEQLKEYRQGKLSPDDAKNSGLMNPQSRLLILKGVQEKEKLPPEPELQGDAASPSHIQHLRVIWIVVSMLILLVYFSRKDPEPEVEEA